MAKIETFHVTKEEFLSAHPDSWQAEALTDHCASAGCTAEEAAQILAGWYYWFCFPGCLPDSDAIGPFDSEQEAVEDARDE